MEDNAIIELYWERSQEAIVQTTKKYAHYCNSISNNILHDNQDVEECVNDTYLRAWNAIPPQRPESLSAFLAKIVRNLSLNKLKQYNTKKRGMGQIDVVLSELDECISDNNSVEQSIDEMLFSKTISNFLERQKHETRTIFVRRYWYLLSINEIAKLQGISESKVKSSLFHTRNKLKLYLEKEGIII